MAKFPHCRDRDFELTSASHNLDKLGRFTVAVMVIEVFRSDTMTLIRVGVREKKNNPVSHNTSMVNGHTTECT